MYIVTRTFRDANGVFKVGSVVEPTDVKAFKSRVQQRHIIKIDEQNVDKWAQYFINRHGIDLTETLAKVASGTMPTEAVTRIEEPVDILEDDEQSNDTNTSEEDTPIEVESTETETGQTDSTSTAW